MDEIVFDQRNKSYGAYALRRSYHKHLLKAIVICFGMFSFGLYTPKMANALGLLSKEDSGMEKTVIIDLKTIEDLPEKFEKEIEKVEPKIEDNQQKFKELIAADKDDQMDPNIQNDKLDNIGATTVVNKDTSHAIVIYKEPEEVIKIVETKPFVEVDQKAQFIGGIDAFQKFLETTLIYPKMPLEDGIEGTAFVTFVVSLDGKVTDVKISGTSGNTALDEEARRVIKRASGMFRPGKVKGEEVISYCSIPIEFVVETDD